MMECCSTNILNLGCYPFTIGEIDSGWVADADGEWKVVTHYHGIRREQVLDLENGDPLVIDTTNWNEDYTYTIQVFAPDGTLFESGGYDGFWLKLEVLI